MLEWAGPAGPPERPLKYLCDIAAVSRRASLIVVVVLLHRHRDCLGLGLGLGLHHPLSPSLAWGPFFFFVLHRASCLISTLPFDSVCGVWWCLLGVLVGGAGGAGAATPGQAAAHVQPGGQVVRASKGLLVHADQRFRPSLLLLLFVSALPLLCVCVRVCACRRHCVTQPHPMDGFRAAGSFVFCCSLFCFLLRTLHVEFIADLHGVYSVYLYSSFCLVLFVLCMFACLIIVAVAINLAAMIVLVLFACTGKEHYLLDTLNVNDVALPLS